MEVKPPLASPNSIKDMEKQQLAIHNIKYSCFVNRTKLKKCLWETRHQDGAPGDFGSYLSRRFSTFTYFAFPSSGTLNVANCKCEDDILKSLEIFMDRVGLDEGDMLSPTKINNLTAVGCYGAEINLGALAMQLCQNENKEELKIKQVTLSQRHFVCLRVKFQPKGLISIFASGKFNIVGFSDVNKVRKLYKSLCEKISKTM